MIIHFRLDSSDRLGVCSVPDELDNRTIEGMDAIEEIVADCISSMMLFEWKFDDEPDEKYRLGRLAEWRNMGELCDRIAELEAEVDRLKSLTPATESPTA